MTKKDLVLPLRRIPPLGEFLDALQIKPAGLAAQLFTGVYNQLFVWSTDLRAQYDQYYCVEYPTLAAYLEIAHEIYLEPTELEKTHILKIKAPGGVLEEAYDDNVRDTVIDCVRELESSYED
ncbi:MAG: hypothetical protein PGN23_08990 [Sphingomonas adhaesiva]|uniref:hypothetical protein n=1 Tax=Sphingomonas adhaesiva TaxID=28212 RepID=UPI002FF89B38